jgi:primosomal protein N''
MATRKRTSASAEEIARLVEELEKAEAYEQRLRRFIVDAKDQLARGNASVALSVLNQALNCIDSAADVVTGTGTGSSP